MDVTEDVAATLRAENHGHPPCVMGAAGFCTEHSAQARGIGYEEETSPTLRAGTVPAAVYENHSQDTRYTGPLETAPTVMSTYGTGGNNQPFVVETPKTLKIRSGCDGGGKGALIQENKSATLGCNNDQTVFVPFVKGTRPHSPDEGQQWRATDVANTLNTYDVGEAGAMNWRSGCTASAPSRATPCCPTIPTAVFMKRTLPGAWTGAAATPPATRAVWRWWRCRVP